MDLFCVLLVDIIITVMYSYMLYVFLFIYHTMVMTKSDPLLDVEEGYV